MGYISPLLLVGTLKKLQP